MDRLIGILQGNAALKITDLRRNINVKVNRGGSAPQGLALSRGTRAREGPVALSFTTQTVA